MKQVSYKVAKALRDAGYPQGKTLYRYVTCDVDTYKEGEIIDAFYEVWASNNVIDAPLALDVWLWLWREKMFSIDVDCYNCIKWATNINGIEFNDPEEAIIAGIEYLVDKKLLK